MSYFVSYFLIILKNMSRFLYRTSSNNDTIGIPNVEDMQLYGIRDIPENGETW